MDSVLIVDDEESICWGLSKLCDDMGLTHEVASSAEAGIEKAADGNFDAVILDVNLPGISGIEAIEQFLQRLGSKPIIMITAYGDLQTAIEAIQQGAFEYIVKPFDLDAVKRTIRQAIATSRMREASVSSEKELSGDDVELVGSSAMMQEVFRQIALTTTSDAPVLVTGESGTGKELTARSIHRYGIRADGPFVPVNIAALNPGLAESELFGHVKGAFTGADLDREGLIQRANGGTLFLDEVAEIPFSIQVKLLRVLDQQEVTPVGSSQPVKTDFRLISATHQDLLSQVNHGEFRHDLFYRIRTFEIRLPALRQRLDDLPELVGSFLKKFPTKQPVATEEFIAALRSRRWPGNVRELQSAVERAAALARGSGFLTPEHLESEEINNRLRKSDFGQQLDSMVASWLEENWDCHDQGGLYERFVAEFEHALLPKAFQMSGQQYSAAARKLGIHRTTLKKKLDELASM